MSRIADIRVVWSEQTPVPTAETNPEFFGNHVEVKYESYPTLALSNRFKPLSDLTTDGVLNIDDDIIIECGALQMAFETWQHSQNQLVGWIPRLHTPVDGAKTCGPKGNPVGCKEVTYQNWITVWWEGQYSIILTKMAFMHADYLRIYTEQTPKELIEWVDEHKNCEDILMQFVVSNATRAPPVLVQGAYYDTGIYNGISAGSGHMKFRSECVNKFFGVYGDVLVPSKSFTTSLGNLYSKLSYFGFLYNH